VLEESIFTVFRDIGRDLFLRGLVSSHAGNISLREGQTIWITRKGAMLGRITREDLVEVDLTDPGPDLSRASSEVFVHRAIYQNTAALAVVHAHPPFSTLLSMIRGELAPIDWEGSYHFKRVPVVGVEKDAGSQESAELVSDALHDRKVVMLRGHGSFARGRARRGLYVDEQSRSIGVLPLS
jgi:L-fuculose-phosphate aldolase